MKSFRVIPEVQQTALPEDHKPSYFGYALGFAFLTYMIVGMFVLFTKGPDGLPFALVAGAVVGGPVGLVICWVRLSSLRQKYAMDLATKRAAEVAREAAELLTRCQTEQQRLTRALTNADGWISNAEQEYQERAYGPFWEAIERTAKNLAAADASARFLGASNQRYQALLRGRQHDFPPRPFYGPIPDPAHTIMEFRAIVRKGQTDFEFATIWEHRATRMVLIEGFGSVGEAVNGIASRLSEGVAGLRSEVSEGLHTLVEGQEETLNVLQQQDQKLENIQRRPTPPLLGG